MATEEDCPPSNVARETRLELLAHSSAAFDSYDCGRVTKPCSTQLESEDFWCRLAAAERCEHYSEFRELRPERACGSWPGNGRRADERTAQELSLIEMDG
jgi:hypothetical protein